MSRKKIVVSLALAGLLSMASCSDDEGRPATPPGGEDVGVPDAAEPEPAPEPEPEPEPDPVPQDDQERVLFVPETESRALPGLKARTHVVRTEMGVPHIFAEDRLDLGRTLGFTVARDRFFVMDLQRRLALGTLSELLGDLALDIDMESRITGMTFVADRILTHMEPEDAAFLDAYAEGINTYIDAVEAGELPPPSELQAARSILGASKVTDLMKPFDRRGVAAMVAVIMYQTNFETGDVDRDRKAARLDGLFEGAAFEELRRAGARQDVWEDLRSTFPYASTSGFEIVEGGGGSEGGADEGAGSARRKSSDPEMMARAASRLGRLKQRLGRKEAENFGSNTWAVQGTRTTDGSALVAGDGHLPLYVPSLMYQIGMNTELFGGGDIHQAGLLITSLPLLAVGTNGHIAWSQVNPVADITDWYREELVLGDDGLPAATIFEGQQRPLEAHAEAHEVAEIARLDSVGRSVTWTRYTTFDGRFLFDVEGRELGPDEVPRQGEGVVVLSGRRVVPGDRDEDGKITAISFDYTAFDTTNYVGTLRRFTEARTVREYQEASKGLIGNMLYAAVVDGNGDILFTPYQAVPCRTYLPRGEDRAWLPGADPTLLIDGTRFGGFTIPSGVDGKVDEGPGQQDPYRCVVPFDETPQVINPPEGFVSNANNQPAPITDDGRLDDDPWYIGGPWSSVRADSIATGLRAAVADNSASIEKMAEIQAFTKSRLGELFTEQLIDMIALGRTFTLTDRALQPHEGRLADLYSANSARLDEVEERLKAWSDRGFGTSPGLETFYHAPDADDVEDSVATMIFNAWLPRAIQATFRDEDMGAAWRYGGGRMEMRVLKRMLDGRGPDNVGQMGSWNEETGESIFFDVLGTDEVERSDELLVGALVDALNYLAGPGGADEGGFGTDDMAEWRWGMRHQVRFESILADFLPEGSGFDFLLDAFSITTRVLPLGQGLPGDDPRRQLKWFPRPGDNLSVDAASPGFSGTSFTYGSGPVMRMVIAIKDGQVRGQNIVPGGQSGLITSPFFNDQAALWLGNQTIPMRYTIPEITTGALGRETFTP